MKGAFIPVGLTISHWWQLICQHKGFYRCDGHGVEDSSSTTAAHQLHTSTATAPHQLYFRSSSGLHNLHWKEQDRWVTEHYIFQLQWPGIWSYRIDCAYMIKIPYTRKVFIRTNFRHFRYLRWLILKVANLTLFLYVIMESNPSS